MMALLGLHDDYVSDGRVLLEDVSRAVLPAAYRNAAKFAQLVALESAYKQVNADVGVFGLATLQASTRALESTSAGDAVYRSIERALTKLGSERTRWRRVSVRRCTILSSAARSSRRARPSRGPTRPTR